MNTPRFGGMCLIEFLFIQLLYYEMQSSLLTNLLMIAYQ